ncbi:MAG: hypothetical protein AB1403_00690 [Candidatus Riflebacteria bacterium]
MKPIHILRPGKFKAMNGTEVEFAVSDLETVARSYDPAVFQAPIVVGHPKDNDPAFGWVKSLKAVGEKLIAEPERLVAQFAELVQQGIYKKVSASLFTPDHSSNPKPGEYYLKHVGFLGAAAPGIPGLDPVNFAADEEAICVEFSIEPESDDQERPVSAGTEKPPVPKEKNNLDKEKQALEAQKKGLEEKEASLKVRERNIKRLEFSAFVDSLKKEGKVLPAFEKDLVNFMESIDGEVTVEFAETQKTPLDFFKDYLKKQPNIVSLAEFAAESKAAPGEMTSEQLAEKAVQLKQKLQGEGVTLSFSEAVERVKAGGN